MQGRAAYMPQDDPPPLFLPPFAVRLCCWLARLFGSLPNVRTRRRDEIDGESHGSVH